MRDLSNSFPVVLQGSCSSGRHWQFGEVQAQRPSIFLKNQCILKEGKGDIPESHIPRAINNPRQARLRSCSPRALPKTALEKLARGTARVSFETEQPLSMREARSPPYNSSVRHSAASGSDVLGAPPSPTTMSLQ